MDYIDATTSGTLSPHILPMLDLQMMLTHIQDTLPSTLHLPISPEDNLYLYRFLCTHMSWLLKSNFYCSLMYLFRIDLNKSPYMTVFTLHIPHGNFSAGYDIDTKYLGITSDETMAMALSTSQFKTCQAANGQFCSMSTLSATFGKPTNMYLSLVCHKFCTDLIALFYTDPKTCRSNNAYSSSPQCLDYHHITFWHPSSPLPKYALEHLLILSTSGDQYILWNCLQLAASLHLTDTYHQLIITHIGQWTSHYFQLAFTWLTSCHWTSMFGTTLRITIMILSYSIWAPFLQSQWANYTYTYWTALTRSPL